MRRLRDSKSFLAREVNLATHGSLAGVSTWMDVRYNPMGRK